MTWRCTVCLVVVPGTVTRFPSSSVVVPDLMPFFPFAVTVSAPVYVRPVSGAVLTPFSGDTLLFQPTMGDWRVHAGTDFSAEAGETVLALTDGTVQQIAEDGLYGTCVTLTHNNGLTSSYCGMDDVRVQEGQVVSAGEALGVCADSIPAESALGTHVHVQVTQNDAPIDVLTLLDEDEPE